MIGWKPNPFIFVHIPKCAGTSIEQVLIPVVTTRQSFRDLTRKERQQFWLPGTQMLQHSKLRRYARHFPIDKHYKFAFVRNPWDRTISQIEFLQNRNAGNLFQGEDFKQHIQIYCQYTRQVIGHDLGACQLDYLLNHAGAVDMDFIGRFESLESDFKKVCASLSLDPAPNLPHVFNSKRARHYSAYYDEESAEWVRARFAKDIEYFGYKFESGPSESNGSC